MSNTSSSEIDDCVLIEDIPEIIVIDDDGEFNSSENAYSKLVETEKNKAKVNIKTKNNEEKSKDIKTENEELEKPEDQNEAEPPPMFYEDVSTSFTIEDQVPLYVDSEFSVLTENKNTNADDVVLTRMSATTLRQKRTRRKIYDLRPTTLRKNRKLRKRLYDDSVIFVSEKMLSPNITNLKSSVPSSNDISVLDESNDGRNVDGLAKRLKKCDGVNRTQMTQQKSDISLDTETPPNTSTTERNRNDIYNLNAYNANNEEPMPAKRMIIIDGSNLAYAYSCRKEFSVKGIEIALQYFAKIGHEAKAVVPQYRMQRRKSSNPELLESLHRDGKIVLTPCKNLPGKSTTCYDGRFILELAVEFDAVVVSNDSYRDLLNENPAFKKVIETRVIGYSWCNDMFLLPKDPYGREGPSLSIILNTDISKERK